MGQASAPVKPRALHADPVRELVQFLFGVSNQMGHLRAGPAMVGHTAH